IRRYQGVSVASVEGAAARSMDKADRTDGAERAETTLPAPIRVNSRRLGFIYYCSDVGGCATADWKHTETTTLKRAPAPTTTRDSPAMNLSWLSAVSYAP